MTVDNKVGDPKPKPAASTRLELILVKLLKLPKEFVLVVLLDPNTSVAHFYPQRSAR
eukprot:CAMPEP_0171804816 /NCGR_PEP_ID=MMETSP0991-20121206/74328_1 /TAXON_ID=483369 /ORGANISM="non described non described, Strain CCMP2098" /LENGTH=56 /DNA_ID=CAMNT_0012417245 /DNA_START=104 /DNA_END=274 /DNA_ORIENTATION=-